MFGPVMPFPEVSPHRRQQSRAVLLPGKFVSALDADKQVISTHHADVQLLVVWSSQ